MSAEGTCLDGLSVAQLGYSVAATSAAQTWRLLGAEVTRIVIDGVHGGRLPADAGEREAVVALDRGVDPVDVPGEELLEVLRGFDAVVCDASALPGWQRLGDAGDDFRAYRAFVHAVGVASWVTVSPYGIRGPKRHLAANELLVHAASGTSAHMRDAHGLPMVPGGHPATVAGGQFAVLAGLHGVILSRREGGRAVHQDLSIQDSTVVSGTFLECAHLLFDCVGTGGSARYSAPAGIVRCADGWMSIVVLEDHQWERLKGVLGHPVWADQIRDRDERRRRSDEVQERFARWASTRSAAECVELLQAAGVPATRVNDCGDLLADDDLARRRFFEESDGMRLPALPAVTGSRRPVLGSVDGRSDERVRVLDLSQVLAGPLAASWLGAMGFDVVKVEDPDRLDTYRRAGPFAEGIRDVENSAYFAAANYSKEGVTLGFETPEGREQLAELLAGSDFVIENLTASRALKILPPELVEKFGASVISGSGFGRLRSRRANWRAYGHNIHAHGGLVANSPDPEGTPTDVGTAWADPLTALWIALFIASQSLIEQARRRDVDVSMSEVVATEFPDLFARAQGRSELLQQDQPSEAGRALEGIYPCAGADRWIAISARTERDVEALERIVGTDLGDDPARLPAFTRTQERDDLVRRLQQAGVPASGMLTAEDLVEDEHLRARGLFAVVDHAKWGRRALTGLPWLEVGSAAFPITSSPLLGNSPESVLRRWRRAVPATSAKEIP